MTHKFIFDILKRELQLPIILDDCVLNFIDDKNIIYSLRGETDYIQRELEISYADNHSDIIWKGTVHTKEELENIILDSLK